MAASVLYTNFGGMLIQEDRGGSVRTYAHDEMGNTSYLLDDTTVTDSYEYTPYGQVSHTGSSPTPFTFIGALGYFATGWSFLTSYVRARWYSSVSGNWGAVDQYWPFEPPYQYVRGQVENWSDPSGKMHPALLACLVSGGITSVVSWVSGDDFWKGICKGAISCALSALLAFILPAVGVAAGCLLGAVASIGNKFFSDLLCEKKCCKIPEKADLVCTLVGLVWDLVSGCLGAGNPKGKVDPVTTGHLEEPGSGNSTIAAMITGFMGDACKNIGVMAPRW